jgi:hypothetical protein
MKTDEIVKEVKDKFVWKWSFTLVLLFNAAYVVLFYYLMKIYG